MRGGMRGEEAYRRMAMREGRWRLAGIALSPLGAMYGLAMHLRRRMYDAGLLRKVDAGAPVVSIGNLEVGGTGKTPVTVWLARRLVSEGLRVAVVARDLNRSSGEPADVSPPAVRQGPGAPSDEVLMLARHLPGCPVFAGPVKAEAARKAVREASPDIVLVDDGFQHLRLRRDMDIVVLDFDHPLGMGGVIPAGTLREFPSALSGADCFWVNRMGPERSSGWLSRTLGAFSRHAMLVTSRPVPMALELPGGGSVDPGGSRVVAFCGIGSPGSFRRTLEEAGCLIADFRAFPDHHTYTPGELVALEELRKSLRADLVVTTEKDAVKLGTPGLKLNICSMRMEMEVEGEHGRLVERIKALVRRRPGG